MFESIEKGRSVGGILREQSFITLEPIYSEETIALINHRLDAVFKSQHQARRYADAIDLYNLGLYSSIFTRELLFTLFSVISDPVLYHFHAYEIDGFNSRPHISDKNHLDGWHRDMDCIHDLSNNNIQHVSLFVYLTDVGDVDGAFEICDKPLGYFPRLFKTSRFYKIKGMRGHTFLFNRTAMHRASPNEGSVNRRVLKISFQSKNTPSEPLQVKVRSHQKHFALIKAKEFIPEENLLLRSLFGDDGVKKEALYEELRLLKEDMSESFSSDPSPFAMKYDMNVIKEFRGVAKDLLYVKKLLLRRTDA